MAGGCCRKNKKPRKNTKTKRRLKFSRYTGGKGCTFQNEPAVKCSTPNTGSFSTKELPNGQQKIAKGMRSGGRSSFPRKGEPYRI